MAKITLAIAEIAVTIGRIYDELLSSSIFHGTTSVNELITTRRAKI